MANDYFDEIIILLNKRKVSFFVNSKFNIFFKKMVTLNILLL